MKNDLKVGEFVVVVLTAVVALSAGALYGWLNFPEMNRITLGMNPDDADFYRAPVIMEICCVFFSTLYFTGQFLARRIGDHSSAAHLEAASRSHMRLLHIMSGGFILVRQTFFRPEAQSFSWQTLVSLLVGLAVVVFAARQKEMPGWSAIFPPPSKS